jgi:hypothetical protein
VFYLILIIVAVKLFALEFNSQKVCIRKAINPLNAELNLVCHWLALLGAYPVLHVSKIRVKCCHYNHLLGVLSHLV